MLYDMVDDFVVISWKFWMESFNSNFNHCRLTLSFNYNGNTVFLLFEVDWDYENKGDICIYEGKM